MKRTALRTTAAAFGVLAPLLAFAPAQAGGAPDLGTVTVDQHAVTDRHGDLLLSGTYRCAAEGSVRILADVYGWRNGTPGTSFVMTSVICDGATHRWTTTAPRGSYSLTGRAVVWGSLEVCDLVTDSCPRNAFDQAITVRPGK